MIADRLIVGTAEVTALWVALAGLILPLLVLFVVEATKAPAGVFAGLNARIGHLQGEVEGLQEDQRKMHALWAARDQVRSLAATLRGELIQDWERSVSRSQVDGGEVDISVWRGQVDGHLGSAASSVRAAGFPEFADFVMQQAEAFAPVSPEDAYGQARLIAASLTAAMSDQLDPYV